MSNLTDIGNLMHLYMDQIQAGEGTDAPEFLITATAKNLNKFGGRNWVPVIVKETGEDQYEVIGNSFIYAVAEEAGLEKVWCIIADPSDESVELTKVLAGEVTPKINLTIATRDDIKAALQYLIEKPGTDLKSVKLLIATDRIDEAPRQYWKTLEPITKLKCGITTGKKLNALKEVFYLTPQPMPEVIKDSTTLNTLTAGELRDMAKKRGIPGYSKKKKDELVKLLS
ncbi:Rho termination factor N-terminal domain-containing protein [Trichocoleus sp. FACHB-90]|uniref:Rho termination factor N-terminal domain-containing protein n=1 Tax=Cyanophyceae TaxID=3028117 RepID=UPI001688E35B|nr:Rho termination factor N-terminal domain-containing protein [Trichocoleus sp. FACHB-90]MBD1925146.1 Rho termination factor N-terminal domain-containing protein [Trichocoleus sp. FACHB-90]